ncbi:MAG: tetratricopeptide repeat protein [Bacteroidales bacterium]|nr:tetratricopeptide repeat protein [Bacteroidales bacterium]MBN2819277.1 tetratricopeptide repeat protein [Bacteroidales bacterium]
MSKQKYNPQHDGFQTVEEALTKTERYIEENRKSLSIIIIVILIVVGGFFSYKKFYLEPKENEAQSEMFMAEKYFELDSFNLTLEGDGQYKGLLDIIDDYAATKSANLACYYAGISYLRLGQYEDAIDYLKDFDGNDRLVSIVALGAIGDAYVELDEYEKGVSYYEKAANLNENELLSPVYLMKSGIVYESINENKKALDVYEQIKANYPNSTEAEEIDKYITAVKLKM